MSEQQAQSASTASDQIDPAADNRAQRRSEHAGQRRSTPISAEIQQGPSEGQTEMGDQLRDMFGMDAEQWESYEALDNHIKGIQLTAVIGMVVIPVACLLAVLGVYAVGAERIAMALAMPLLFVAGIAAMAANISRSQLGKLKRLRDSWSESGS